MPEIALCIEKEKAAYEAAFVKGKRWHAAQFLISKPSAHSYSGESLSDARRPGVRGHLCELRFPEPHRSGLMARIGGGRPSVLSGDATVVPTFFQSPP